MKYVLSAMTVFFGLTTNASFADDRTITCEYMHGEWGTMGNIHFLDAVTITPTGDSSGYRKKYKIDFTTQLVSSDKTPISPPDLHVTRDAEEVSMEGPPSVHVYQTTSAKDRMVVRVDFRDESAEFYGFLSKIGNIARAGYECRKIK